MGIKPGRDDIADALAVVWPNFKLVNQPVAAELESWVAQWIRPTPVKPRRRAKPPKKQLERMVSTDLPPDAVPAKDLVMTSSTLRWRVEHGWAPLDALLTPVRKWRPTPAPKKPG
jgi:hypothetical protein